MATNKIVAILIDNKNKVIKDINNLFIQMDIIDTLCISSTTLVESFESKNQNYLNPILESHPKIQINSSSSSSSSNSNSSGDDLIILAYIGLPTNTGDLSASDIQFLTQCISSLQEGLNQFQKRIHGLVVCTNTPTPSVTHTRRIEKILASKLFKSYWCVSDTPPRNIESFQQILSLIYPNNKLISPSPNSPSIKENNSSNSTSDNNNPSPIQSPMCIDKLKSPLINYNFNVNHQSKNNHSGGGNKAGSNSEDNDQERILPVYKTILSTEEPQQTLPSPPLHPVAMNIPSPTTVAPLSTPNFSSNYNERLLNNINLRKYSPIDTNQNITIVTPPQQSQQQPILINNNSNTSKSDLLSILNDDYKSPLLPFPNSLTTKELLNQQQQFDQQQQQQQQQQQEEQQQQQLVNEIEQKPPLDEILINSNNNGMTQSTTSAAATTNNIISELENNCSSKQKQKNMFEGIPFFKRNDDISSTSTASGSTSCASLDQDNCLNYRNRRSLLPTLGKIDQITKQLISNTYKTNQEGYSFSQTASIALPTNMVVATIQSSKSNNGSNNNNSGSTDGSPCSSPQSSLSYYIQNEAGSSPILGSSNGYGPDVMVVEDNDLNAGFLLKLLEKFGVLNARCLWVTDGLQAVQSFKSSRNPFRLILMDLFMPIMDGYEATNIIRQLEGDFKHTPIVTVTANVTKGAKEKCLTSGFDGYIAKPIRADELKHVVDRYVHFLNLNK
ncbi:hypothetical protein CYY_004266 [Polysphondylium violaceum]|uniref:Response regulatory domain-containing protein n=1 Tax=Polysphondylium violaceum TaxID=133409 RepID=A0A8J4PVI5_9MYCE|nr:hypothetical protein CYY_004266 [Polysphondylium violaceum]